MSKLAPPTTVRKRRLILQGALLAAVLGLGGIGIALYGPRDAARSIQAVPEEATRLESVLQKAIRKSPADRTAALRYVDFLVERRRNLDALEVCREAARAIPDDPAIRAALAETLAQNGRVPEAIRILTPSSPAQTDLRLQLAGLLVRSGQPERAVPVIAEVGNPTASQAQTAALLLIDARHPDKAVSVLRPFTQAELGGELLNTYGFALLQSGRYPEAAAVLRQVAAHSHGIATLPYYAGCALRLAGRPADLSTGVDELRQATSLEPQEALFQFELAQGLMRQGDWAGAQEALELAAGTGAELPEIQRDLAQAAARNGDGIASSIARARYLQAVDDAPAAVGVLQSLTLQHPDDIKLGLAYSVALHAAGKFPEATAAVVRLRKLKPENSDVLWSQYHLHNELKQYDQSLLTLGALAALPSPTNPDPTLLQERATTLQRLARYPEAEELLFKLRDLQPENATHHYNLGQSLLLWSTRPDAKTLAEAELKRAIELRPAYSEAYYALGQLALGQGHAAEAVPYLRRALDFTPAHPDGLRLLGRTYLQLGDKTRSEDAFQLFRAIKARSDEQARLELPVQQLRDIHRSRMALARFHLRNGELTPAIKQLEIVEYQFPDDRETHQLLAPLYGHARRFQRQFEERQWLKAHGLLATTGGKP